MKEAVQGLSHTAFHVFKHTPNTCMHTINRQMAKCLFLLIHLVLV